MRLTLATLLAESRASAEPEFAAQPGALPVIKRGHAGLERNVYNPPE
jgi:hypothetical protein